jgi:hypothetical protein
MVSWIIDLCPRERPKDASHDETPRRADRGRLGTHTGNPRENTVETQVASSSVELRLARKSRLRLRTRSSPHASPTPRTEFLAGRQMPHSNRPAYAETRKRQPRLSAGGGGLKFLPRSYCRHRVQHRNALRPAAKHRGEYSDVIEGGLHSQQLFEPCFTLGRADDLR